MGHLLSHHLAGVEFNQHATVRFQFFYRNREAEVVQKEELELKVV